MPEKQYKNLVAQTDLESFKNADRPITDLTDDSRQVSTGCCFIARDDPDSRWKHYVDMALQNGAAAIIAPAIIDVPEGIGLATGAAIDQAMAGRIADIFFNRPADQLRLIGVTGTNGKTTVATLTQHLLQAGGIKSGLIGTVQIDACGPADPRPAELTTPGAIELRRLFREMADHGCEACAMEVSSHALDQGRVDGLNFDVAVFTNLTQDHLDYHGTMEAYAGAKAKLFETLDSQATAVLNADDSAALQMVQHCEATLVWTSVSGSAVSHDDEPALQIHPGRHESHLSLMTARVLEADARGCRVRLSQGLAESELHLPLAGLHNVSNWLQAVAAAVAAGADWKDAEQVFSELSAVPGRLEAVRIEKVEANRLPGVFVDYAHTPDALENVIGALRPLVGDGGRLICVFGCGGDRDRSKRPKMAAVASILADAAVLTSDNPRTEDPQQILDDAWTGVAPDRRRRVAVEIDRSEAIRRAVSMAKSGDIVLIAGKGHEDYQIIADAEVPGGTRKIHFDDREQAAAAMQQYAMDHRESEQS